MAQHFNVDNAKVREALRKKFRAIVSEINPEGYVLDEMISGSVINFERRHQLDLIKIKEKCARELLTDILTSTKPDDCNIFLNALQRDYGHLVDQILAQIHDSDTVCQQPAYLKRLGEIIEPRFGLIEDLSRIRLLSVRDYNAIISKQKLHVDEASDELIRRVFLPEKRPQFGSFLQALREAHQSHVANFIEGKGVVCSTYGDDRPLSEEEGASIHCNRRGLVQWMDTSHQLIDKLVQVEAITNEHKNYIDKQQGNEERTKALLDILLRCSSHSLTLFKTQLSELGLTQITDCMENSEVPIPVHTYIFSPLTTTPSLKEREAEIAIGMHEICTQPSSSRTPKSINALLEFCKRIGLTIKNVLQGNSIELWFGCKSRESLSFLGQLMVTGSLHILLTDLIACMSRREVLMIELNLFDQDFECAKKCFEDLESYLNSSSTNTSKCMTGVPESNLPMETIELIVVRATLQLLQHLNAVDVYITMSSVCKDWRNALKGRWVLRRIRHPIWRQIIVNNRIMIRENLDPRFPLNLWRKFIEPNVKCKTKIASTRRSSNIHLQNDIIIEYLDNNPAKFPIFLRTLAKTDQHHIVNVLRQVVESVKGDMRPLPLVERNNIQNKSIRALLSKNIFVTDMFLNDLTRDGAITVLQSKRISSKASKCSSRSKLDGKEKQNVADEEMGIVANKTGLDIKMSYVAFPEAETENEKKPGKKKKVPTATLR